MIIADTGFWLAIANRKDKYHPQAVKILSIIQEKLITTWPVLTETCHLLLNRLGKEALLNFIALLETDAFAIFAIEETHYVRIKSLMKQYQDLPMDLADASLVLLAEQVGHGNILSTDERDFKTYRWKNTKPFNNLLLKCSLN